MLASLATIMKEKTALVTSMVYFALTKKESVSFFSVSIEEQSCEIMAYFASCEESLENILSCYGNEVLWVLRCWFRLNEKGKKQRKRRNFIDRIVEVWVGMLFKDGKAIYEKHKS